jgi:hypothetical protein
LSNHALFYEHNVRTWWKWLLVNPVELLLAVGAPVAMLAAWGAAHDRGDWRGALTSPVASFAIVWGLLWLSGKNMGEGARLWILLTPWVVAAAARSLDPRPEPAAGSGTGAPGVAPRASTRTWLWMLALQSAAAALTVLRVDGFHFTELLR